MYHDSDVIHEVLYIPCVQFLYIDLSIPVMDAGCRACSCSPGSGRCPFLNRHVGFKTLCASLLCALFVVIPCRVYWFVFPQIGNSWQALGWTRLVLPRARSWLRPARNMANPILVHDVHDQRESAVKPGLNPCHSVSVFLHPWQIGDLLHGCFKGNPAEVLFAPTTVNSERIP
jgi:hypothetical protein